MTEQNRKTLRSFYCRDYLWELFEVMTRDLGCSMDYLINEAMRHYARSRNYSLTGAGISGPGLGAGYSQPGFPPAEAQGHYGAAPAVPPAPPAAPASPPPSFSSEREGFARGGGFEHRTFERMPTAGASGNRFQARPRSGNRFQVPNPPRPASPPPPPVPAAKPPAAPAAPPASPTAPPVAPQAGPAPAGRPQLSLIFNDQRYPITKDKFIIGRASQMTDLTIRDGNISRKHCAIIFRGNQYYIKDLDSTNGIEYKGQRIDSKKVEEGDTYHICEYELRFSYR